MKQNRDIARMGNRAKDAKAKLLRILWRNHTVESLYRLEASKQGREAMRGRINGQT